MSDLFRNLGFIRLPLTLALILVVLLTIWSGAMLFRRDAEPDLRTKAWLDAILFWGGFAFIAGLLGTLLGVIVAAGSIEMAGEVEPTLVWGGLKIALTSSAAGATILSFAALFWFVLQMRWRLLAAATEPHDPA